MKTGLKRTMALVLTGMLCASALTGCGGGSGDTGGTGDQPAAQGGGASADKTVLKVQWIGDFKSEDATNPISGETNKGLHVLEEEFEKQHEDIDLQFILMGWDDYQKKTQAMLIAGDSDVYQAPGIASIAEQGLLEPLQAYIDRDSYDLGVYIDGQVDGWKVVGPEDSEPQIYGLPMIGDTRFLVYDKQIFDDWGVPYLSETPTPEEILAAAKQMTGANPKTGKENFGLFHKGGHRDEPQRVLRRHMGHRQPRERASGEL